MTSHCPEQTKYVNLLRMTPWIRQNLKWHLCALMTSWWVFLSIFNMALDTLLQLSSFGYGLWSVYLFILCEPHPPFHDKHLQTNCFHLTLSQLCGMSNHNHCPQLKSTILLLHCWTILPICVSPFMPFFVCVLLVAILASFHIDVAVKQPNHTFYSLTYAP